MNYNYPPPPMQQPQPYAATPISVTVEPAVAAPATPADPQAAYYGATPMQPQPAPAAYYPPPPQANFIQAPVVTPDPNYYLPVAHPQQRIELDDEAKTFKKFVMGLIPALIIDIIFCNFSLLSIFGIICGFVYCCNYQIGLLGVYLIYRYVFIVYLFFILFAVGFEVIDWVIMVVNILLTAYATFVITKANSVSKRYTAEQLKNLQYDSLLTNILSINLHTYKLH